MQMAVDNDTKSLMCDNLAETLEHVSKLSAKATDCVYSVLYGDTEWRETRAITLAGVEASSLVGCMGAAATAPGVNKFDTLWRIHVHANHLAICVGVLTHIIESTNLPDDHQESMRSGVDPDFLVGLTHAEAVSSAPPPSKPIVVGGAPTVVMAVEES